jgi:hypothetical protein
MSRTKRAWLRWIGTVTSITGVIMINFVGTGIGFVLVLIGLGLWMSGLE